MSFFRRLLSADYRAAIAAEAAGDFDLAAERYALAGELESAVKMHLARAERAERRADEIAALRDAFHWVTDESELRSKVARALGQALLARAQAEGIATSRDKDRVREAAAMLTTAGDHRGAGDAYSEIGDDQAAAASYKKGGLVAQLEQTLARQEKAGSRSRTLREAFADYELYFKGGERDSALEAIRLAVEVADSKAQYRRLLDELESRLIVSGKVVLRTRKGQRITACTGPTVAIGRDALCDVILRSGGVSRRHSQINLGQGGGFLLSDSGSRNGTKIGGMPIDGEFPLEGSGEFALGDECVFRYTLNDTWIDLEVTKGVDSGTRLLVAREDSWFPLPELEARLCFHDGRPMLESPEAGTRLFINGERVVHGSIQLIHSDELSIDGIEIEVL